MTNHQLKEILVNAKESKETTNPNEYLKTCEISTCVGLALVEDLNSVRKRGLTYVSYDASNCYNAKGVCKLTPESEQRGSKILEKIISQFRGLQKFPKRLEDAEKIRAYVIANRTKQEKIKKPKVKEGLPKDIGKINPMFDFILNWLSKQNITLALSDAVLEWRKESDELDNKLYPIYTKIIVLHQKELNILYMDNDNKLLNSSTYSHHI
jgi:hypothetical protein